MITQLSNHKPYICIPKFNMKKILSLSVVCCLALLGFNSCSEDFQVTAPYKDITFVYGFLDMKDTAHYIRIQKAFLDESKGAIEMAKTPDSSFFNDADLKVEMKVVNPLLPAPNNLVNIIYLNRVDLNMEGYPKDSGIFFSNPSYAYKFKDNLNASYKYRLVITNLRNGTKDSSEINIINANKFYLNLPTFYKLKFDQTIPNELYKYNLVINFDANSYVKYMEGIIKFNWVEKDVIKGTSVRKSANFNIESKPTSNKSQEPLTSYNSRFFSFLRDAIGTAPDGVERYMDSCDIMVYGGGVDYYNYTITKLIQSGLTADQSKPIFTNVSGKDVYGVFTTRTLITRLNVPIDTATMDSLKVNPLTAPLKIKGVSED